MYPRVIRRLAPPDRELKTIFLNYSVKNVSGQVMKGRVTEISQNETGIRREGW